MDNNRRHVPNGWEERKIKQCFKFKNGKGFSGELREKADSDYCYPVYGGNGIIGYCNNPLLDKPTIIVGRVGEYCGNVFKTQEKSWVTDNAMLVSEVLLEDFDINFWTVMLNSLHFNHFSDSTGQPKITQGGIGAITVIYPKSVTEQAAISNILSKVDEAIASVQNSIAAAERLKKSLMQNLLTGKMKPDGTFRTPEEFFIDEKFGKVPVGWEVKRVADVSDDVQYGLNLASSETGNIPMLRMNNIVNGEMTDTPLVYVSLESQLLQQYELEEGDILFNRTNSMDLVGKVGIFKLVGKYVFASYLIRIKVSKENNPYYVNMALNSHPIQCSLRSKATPAVSQANINSKSLRHTNILVPKDKQEQDSIVAKIDSIDHILLKEQDKTKKLERLKKSLMQNLLTGKVKISTI